MYYLSILDSSGAVVDRFSDYVSFESCRKVNDVGYISFTLNASHPAIQSIDHLSGVRLYRAEPRLALPYTLENYGLVLSRRWHLVGRVPHFTCIVVHPNWLLSTRVVDYKAGTVDRSSFQGVPAETIAKTLVAYNATAAATEEDGRLRDGTHTILPLTVQSDSGAGTVLNWYCAYQNLASTLLRLTYVGGGDFEVDQSNQFKWYPGQFGTDRTAQLIFSLERGNIANPVYTIERKNEKTVAVVGGIGEGSLRQVVHAFGADYSDENDIEAFTQGFQASTYEGLVNIGERYLAQRIAQPRLTFDILQLYSCAYGKQYFLGDKVTVRNPFTFTDYLAKISEVVIKETFEKGEVIAVRVDTGVADSIDDIPELVSDINTTDLSILDAIDGDTFTYPLAPFVIDAGAFSTVYRIPGIYGGNFVSPPG